MFILIYNVYRKKIIGGIELWQKADSREWAEIWLIL